METNHAKEQACIQLESIHELVEAYNANLDNNDEAHEAITNDALEVMVRSNWCGDVNDWEMAEYQIVLATGSPAVRIKGRLDGYQQPETAQLEYQDWGTPWTRYPLTEGDIKALLMYAGCFYFGE